MKAFLLSLELLYKMKAFLLSFKINNELSNINIINQNVSERVFFCVRRSLKKLPI